MVFSIFPSSVSCYSTDRMTIKDVAKVPKTLVGKLRRYRKLLRAAGIPVAKLVLFGSRARGDFRRDSDIDICVVSKAFGRRRLAEGVQINTLAHQIEPLIEAVPCSLKDWETDRCSPLLHEIRRDGIGVR